MIVLLTGMTTARAGELLDPNGVAFAQDFGIGRIAYASEGPADSSTIA